MSAKQRIGIVGAGLMGHGIAKNLVEKGFPLVVRGHRNRAPIDDQVPEDRERGRAPRLDGDRVAVLERTHVQLAGGRARPRPMRGAVDHHAAGAADPLAAIVVEGDGALALFLEPLVQDVEHLEEGEVGADVVDHVGLEAARGVAPLLTPDLEGQPHYL